MADRDTSAEETKGILLLIGGGAAFLGSFYTQDPRVQKPLQVAGLAAAGIGLYYLVFKGLLGRKADTGDTGGGVGALEDALVGGMPATTNVEVPTVYQPPPPGAPTLPEVIPFTGRVVSPARDSTIGTYFGRAFYRMTIEITNNTPLPVGGMLEVRAEETGTYGGEDTIVQGIHVALEAGETRQISFNMRSTAGWGSFSDTITRVRFAGHHITTTHYTVE